MRKLITLIEMAEDTIADRAAEHFGVTTNPRECGYLLPDGRMLDLSGRHWMLDGDYRRVDGRNVVKRGSDYQADQRQVDHRDLDELSEIGGTEGMFQFMHESGAIRVMPPVGFNLMLPPSRKQITMMCTMAHYFDPEIYIEVYGNDGYVKHSMSFTDLTPARLLAFLKKAGLARIA